MKIDKKTKLTGPAAIAEKQALNTIKNNKRFERSSLLFLSMKLTA